jgi:hypothetical protein
MHVMSFHPSSIHPCMKREDLAALERELFKSKSIFAIV